MKIKRFKSEKSRKRHNRKRVHHTKAFEEIVPNEYKRDQTLDFHGRNKTKAGR